MTRKRSTQEQIDRLRTSAENVRRAENPRQREAHLNFMVNRAKELEATKHDLELKLENGYDVLDLWKENGKPDDYEKHHARYIDWLHEYESACDALDAAARTWTRPAPERAESAA